MPRTLTQRASDAINDFNNAPSGSDYVGLLKRMEYNVVLKRVLSPDSISGIGNVTGYLNFHMHGRAPQITNPNNSLPYNSTYLTQLPASANEATATNGQVSGTGIYVDDSGKSSTKINFTIGFVRKDPNEEWSLIIAFATTG